ncbi:MAG: sulfite exporter TauE/SafE family protein [Anaerolineaceae bacterium]|nr:sulfite exporter TauE/SafE family protein [Anaerolineaceae bacterium]
MAFLTAAFGSLLQGVVGVGLNMFASPILMMDKPGFVPGPVLASALLLTILMVLRDRTGIDLRGIGWMAGGMLPGTALASYLLPVIPHKTISFILAGLVLAGVVLSLTGLHFPPKRWILLLAGFLSGIGSVLASIGGPPIALVNQDMEPKKLRATLSGYFMLSGFFALLGLIPSGRLGANEFHLMLWLFPGVVAGFLISTFFIGKLRGSATRYLLLSLSAISAIILIVQTLLS